ncbi:NADH-quinone oxidoreductase subunit L [Hyperthermus butylicus]|uniref:NADH-quinone oxidoreductase chain 12 n=1 Tax=Hyperthermus butylicus (strain DSM 5456 / JCM 9403 / PLM1-5) TaxID=415426 RepID=A2BJA2_HYPBU|nr:NADH-quinone oxidoreductase subunit L [Hyperthermus butylicus]ABM80063.1 NADH-quinone oxidoreductase chain 12 [Hyperthermus butylicus DSM 5456]
MVEPGVAALVAVFAEYAAALVALLLGAAGARWRGIAWTGVAGAAVSMVASWLAFLGGEGRLEYEWVRSLGVAFSLDVDLLAAIMGVVVATLSFLIAVYSVEYIGEWGAPRYWFFYSFFVASMLLLVYAGDMITLFIGWEGTGLSSWALIGFYYDEREEAWVGDPGRVALGVPMWFTPTHSGLRAIVFTRLGDMGMLIGMGMVYAIIGTTSIAAMAVAMNSVALNMYVKGVLAAWVILFYLGALAKSAQFPFHEWLVTAMTGPTSVSALIHAATMVKAGVYFALRFTPFIAPALFWVGAGIASMKALAWLALLTAFATATMAIVARELKLILAFSTASQLSYMLGAVFAAAAAGDPALGSLGGLAHLVSHAVFKAALFLGAGAIIHAVHSRYITDMGGLRRHMPYTFAAMLLAGASLAALPPFSGWWSKDLAVRAIASLGGFAEAVALLTAVITAAYTFRMIYYVFFGEPRFHGEHVHEAPGLMLGPYLVLGLAALGLGAVWPWVEHYFAEASGAGHVGMELATVLWGTLAALAGTSTVALYFAGMLKPNRPIVSPVERAIHDFLYDRWYVNAIIYKLIVYPGASLARALWGLEKLLDTGLHVVLPSAAEAVSTGLRRRLQSGDLRLYLALFAVGLALALLLALAFSPAQLHVGS